VIVQGGVNKFNHPIHNKLLFVTEPRTRDNIIILSTLCEVCPWHFIVIKPYSCPCFILWIESRWLYLGFKVLIICGTGFELSASKEKFLLTLGFRNIPVPQLPASNSNSSPGLNRSSSLTNSLTRQSTHSTPMHCTNSTLFLHWTASTYLTSLHSTASNRTDLNGLLYPFSNP
jgi:hypothetical protein